MQDSATLIDQIITALPSVASQHSAQTAVYTLFNNLALSNMKELFSEEKPVQKNFGPFGSLTFPYRKMGAIDSLDLFGLDELIMFSFYWANRNRYKRVLDIGANIGLHTILLSKAGFQVDAYEPDRTHFAWLKENLALNGISAHLHNAAVSNKSGEAEFVRVLGNTTSSHLAGSKSAYGELEKYTVKIADIKEIIQGVDLIKMDVEGHEAEILLALTDLKQIDILVEIGSEDNAQKIFNHFNQLGVHLFAQKKGWAKIDSLDEMPTSYRDGTLFISSKDKMPW